MEIAADTAEFQKAAAAIKAAADGALQKEFTTALRDVAKPYGQYVVLAAAKELPKRGGLSWRVASANVTVQATTLRAQITVGGGSQKYKLAAMDQGKIRHPVFETVGIDGKRQWVQQSIRTGLFSVPFAADIGTVRTAMIAAGQRVMQKIASGG